MSRFLVLYASSHGQTREVASAIATRLRRDDHVVHLVDAGKGKPPEPASYDAIVIGSRVHGDKHARSVTRYVQRHRDPLRGLPGAFFSVSMSAAGGEPDRYVPAFLERTGWRPALTAAFAGALPYTRYNPLLRFVMKRISRKAGQPTDTTRDHDFTDWNAVQRFADDIATMLVDRRPAAAGQPPQGTATA